MGPTIGTTVVGRITLASVLSSMFIVSWSKIHLWIFAISVHLTANWRILSII